MKRYLSYLKKVLKHKWYVFIGCARLGIPLAGITHDLSKFRLDEFVPYARSFINKDGTDKAAKDRTRKEIEDFRAAWKKHLDRNPHHPEHWCRENRAYIMPDRYRKEMLADWYGAGIGYGGPPVKEWYEDHKSRLRLHVVTRQKLEAEMEGHKWLQP